VLNEIPYPIEEHMILPTYLMQLNDRMYWAKFNLLPIGRGDKKAYRVILTLDLPSEEFDFPIFRQAALTMSHYLESFSNEILLLSTDNGLAHLATQYNPLPEWFKIVPFEKDEVWTD
jgi:hypothetical protein